jgi:cell division protein FtsN
LELAARRGNGGVALAAAAVVAVASVFALGLELGKRKEPREAPPPPADRLAALDRAEEIAPPAPAPASYVFHDALTKDRPPDTLAQVGRAAPRPAAKPGTAVTTTRVARAPSAARTAPPIPTPTPTSAPTPTPTPASTPTATPTSAPATRPAPPSWTIQLGASPKESEAQRLAAKHPGAHVVAADVDGKRWYRVRLGNFGSRADAQAELPRVDRPGAFVTASR